MLSLNKPPCDDVQVKVWNLEKRDGGNPLCTRIFPAIPGNKPTVVSCLTVHENLNFMAIGKWKLLQDVLIEQKGPAIRFYVRTTWKQLNF